MLVPDVSLSLPQGWLTCVPVYRVSFTVLPRSTEPILQSQLQLMRVCISSLSAAGGEGEGEAPFPSTQQVRPALPVSRPQDQLAYAPAQGQLCPSER